MIEHGKLLASAIKRRSQSFPCDQAHCQNGGMERMLGRLSHVEQDGSGANVQPEDLGMVAELKHVDAWLP